MTFEEFDALCRERNIMYSLHCRTLLYPNVTYVVSVEGGGMQARSFYDADVSDALKRARRYIIRPTIPPEEAHS